MLTKADDLFALYLAQYNKKIRIASRSWMVLATVSTTALIQTRSSTGTEYEIPVLKTEVPADIFHLIAIALIAILFFCWIQLKTQVVRLRQTIVQPLLDSDQQRDRCLPDVQSIVIWDCLRRSDTQTV